MIPLSATETDATPAETRPMATATRTTGFGVKCPHCHSEEGTLKLDLNDLSEISCPECDETFSAEQARDLVAAELDRWEAVCQMVKLARELAAAK
jgi:hypothetical protein